MTHQQDCNQLIFSAVFACQKHMLPNSMTYLFWGHSLYKLEISEKVTEKVGKGGKSEKISDSHLR